ncbi:MAG: MGMT family protein, partial [Alphaproteobacteria bacterium]|nr:MGMT family protein [Alphaproteobacteria bacterium]
MPAKEPLATARQSSRQQRIYALVRRVPEGPVASDGQLARLLGWGARLVGYAMAALPARSEVPWHRVINANGGISPRRSGG